MFNSGLISQLDEVLKESKIAAPDVYKANSSILDDFHRNAGTLAFIIGKHKLSVEYFVSACNSFS